MIGGYNIFLSVWLSFIEKWYSTTNLYKFCDNFLSQIYIMFLFYFAIVLIFVSILIYCKLIVYSHHYIKIQYYQNYLTTHIPNFLPKTFLYNFMVIFVKSTIKTHFTKTHFLTVLYLIINFSLSSFFIYNNNLFSLIFIYLIINFSLTFNF